MTVAPPLASPSDDGLVHLGLVYDDLDDLVARSLPEIRHVLDGGGTVTLTVDRSGVRAFREALGDDADRVTFPSPRGSRGGSSPEFLRLLRTTVDPARRALILGQYSEANSPTWDCQYAEDAVNLVLGDLPLTVLCACARSGEDDHLTLTTRSHPHLIGETGRTPNPDHQAPADTCPAPLTPWGAPRVSMTVSGGEDLAEVRRRVTALGEEAGLAGDGLDAAILTVHEAVLLAGGMRLRADSGPASQTPSGQQELRVRVAGGSMVTEVLAESAVGGTDDAGDLRRKCLAAFCDRLDVHDGPSGRLVRVLTHAV